MQVERKIEGYRRILEEKMSSNQITGEGVRVQRGSDIKPSFEELQDRLKTASEFVRNVLIEGSSHLNDVEMGNVLSTLDSFLQAIVEVGFSRITDSEFTARVEAFAFTKYEAECLIAKREAEHEKVMTELFPNLKRPGYSFIATRKE